MKLKYVIGVILSLAACGTETDSYSPNEIDGTLSNGVEIDPNSSIEAEPTVGVEIAPPSVEVAPTAGVEIAPPSVEVAPPPADVSQSSPQDNSQTYEAKADCWNYLKNEEAKPLAKNQIRIKTEQVNTSGRSEWGSHEERTTYSQGPNTLQFHKYSAWDSEQRSCTSFTGEVIFTWVKN